MNIKPVSSEAKSPKGGRGCAVAFGTIFMLAGLGFLVGTLIYPIIRTRTSGDWKETPCTIVSSKIDISSDSDGTSYRPKVEFEYVANGLPYPGKSYDFTSLNRPKKRCKEIVDAYPAGMQTSCFVNPDDPEDAVIVRSYDFSWLGTIMSLVFAGIGLAIAVAALFYSPKPSNSISGSAKGPSRATGPALGLSSNAIAAGVSSSSRHSADIEDEAWDKPQKLKADHGRLTSFLGVLAMAIFWNGIVSVFIYMVIKEGFDGFQIVFAFVLVGLFIIAAAFQKFGGLFNPKVELALTTGAIKRGDSVDVAWQLEGRTSALRSLSIKVEGEESATYRRGTDTITDKNVFCSIEVAEVQSSEDIEFGSRTVTIPADTMHTFKGDRNRISWRIVVHGDIPWWSDIKETYEFRVRP